MKYGVLGALITGTAILGARTAMAGAEVGSWYVTPKAVYVDPDSNFDADDDFGGSFGIGKVLTKELDLELSYTYSEHDEDGGDTLRLRGVSLDLNRIFFRDSAVNPYLGVGINSIRSRRFVDGEAGPEFGGSLHAGVLADLTRGGGLQLGAEVGKRADDFTRALADVYGSVGLRFNFGAPAKPVPAAAPAPVAAPPPPPAAPPPPADSDRDGVNDDLDKCPNTVAGARVDSSGCELDGDRDGVVDRLDRCPNTPAGDKVDTAGCGVTVRLEVLFDTNSASIKPESYGVLDNFVAFMQEVPSARGTLEGHTDSTGADAYNLRLSQRRADAVQAYVVSKGIDATRIVSKGYGEAQPVADNGTEAGRAENRRVQFARIDMTR